jgi:hypothetical protein
LKRGLDVSVLGVFVSAGEQDYQRLPSLRKVNPIAGTAVDPQLRNAFSNRLDVAWISERKAADANVDPRSGASITQFRKPLAIFLGLTNLDHRLIVSRRIQRGKTKIHYR